MIAYTLAKKVAGNNKSNSSSSQQNQQQYPPPQQQQYAQASPAAQQAYQPRSSVPAASTQVRDGEVLLKVRHNDMHALNGDLVDGSDFVGTVVAVPPTETRWRVGDQVGASCRTCRN